MKPPDTSIIAGKLRPLGFSRYAEYLASPHWQTVRAVALVRAKHQCQARNCQSRKYLHIHHRTYERLGNERPDDLVVLCERHHAAAHKGAGVRINPQSSRIGKKQRKAHAKKQHLRPLAAAATPAPPPPRGGIKRKKHRGGSELVPRSDPSRRKPPPPVPVTPAMQQEAIRLIAAYKARQAGTKGAAA